MNFKKVTTLRISRDSILFFSGLGLIINEAARNGAERPTLLLLFAGMVGLPQFLQRDENSKEAKKDEQQQSSPGSQDTDGSAADSA